VSGAAARPSAPGLTCVILVSAFLSVCSPPGWTFADGKEPTEREIVRRAIQERSSDPWPRGSGHIVLAIPGSEQASKAYHEQGGSFSPAVGSFGVSIWVSERFGALRASSDSIPLDEVRQRFVWPDPKGIPALATKTPYYQAQWSCSGPGRWALGLKTPEKSDLTPKVVIRSVGPAGGPIRSLDWNGERLLVNGWWSVSIEPKPAACHLTHEGDDGWMTARPKRTRWSGEDGWGCARFDLAEGHAYKVAVRDSRPSTEGLLRFPGTCARFKMELPDERFVECLNAQVAHLMMGLMDRRTPPGDPTNYPLAWQRDGAYVVVALARAGQLGVAKELATYFAENDFFGGFGSEADAPGLGIWAVTETAVRLRQPEFDRWLWPHIRRKAEFILRMLATDKPIRRRYAGPIVPMHRKRSDNTLVCDPARSGLVIGKMDHHRPLLYVNAVSYLGLVKAAALAEQLAETADAERWRSRAEGLKGAWLAAFKPPEWNNERTYICGLWPSWVVGSEKEAYQDRLRSLWGPDDAPRGVQGIPLWTYFTVAQTHQWLMLGGLNHVWKNLTWFWGNQASPGLYTWWEGSGEENTFHLWEHVRGWVKPPNVTPHYWTAAEMLLLQIDMLTYLDEAATKPTLVIGGGIPKGWLDKPMSVRGQPVQLGKVDWTWKNGMMYVVVRGAQCDVRLGPAFDTQTAIRVKFSHPE